MTGKRGQFLKGNQLWSLRQSHGRDPLLIYQDKEILISTATEYFQYCIENPILKEDYAGGMAKKVTRKIPRPFSERAFCVFAGISRSGWIEFKKRATDDFLDIIRRIEDIIYNQKFEGAAVGIFNANLISRDLGLVDKKEIDQKVITVTVEGEDENTDDE
ncbi:terminase small subunit [Chitinophaga sp. Hz27]|uniref:terminase small subunit n=1 Tax=Chitinophaga sp. Hz27 TaxID=3347169 RepID=UPI0035D804CC